LWQRRTISMLQSRRWKRACLAYGATLIVAIGLPVRAQTAAEDSAADLVLRALALLETPYRYGGRTPTGFDCSGFVGYVFSEAAGVVLPRRTEDIGRIGAKLSQGELTAGDLVFFNTLGRRFSHVGIYIGNDRFVHAPTRGGRVRVERLSDAYWTARYNGARRVDGGAAAPSTATSATAAAGATVDIIPDLRVTP
jgi:hypothetical protein